MTRTEKFVQSTLAVLKLLGVIVLIIITGKFLYDMMGARSDFSVRIRDLKNLIWRRSPTDRPRESVSNPLTDEDIANELKKLRDSRAGRR